MTILFWFLDKLAAVLFCAIVGIAAIKLQAWRERRRFGVYECVPCVPFSPEHQAELEKAAREADGERLELERDIRWVRLQRCRDSGFTPHTSHAGEAFRRARDATSFAELMEAEASQPLAGTRLEVSQ